jgi:Ca-activated chloride channel family protein
MTGRPTRRRRGQRARLLIAGAFGLLVAATPAAAIDVFIRSPRSTQMVFGSIGIEVEVLSAQPVAAVEFRVDGRPVGRLTAPPWGLVVDVGEENRAHTFEVTATDLAGASATASVTTRRVEVDMELDVGLQQLYVTVSRGGTRVLDLGRDDFAIQDEGATQTMVTFERGDVPLTAALLVDTSTSMTGDRLTMALAGAQRFVAGMRPLDEAMLLLFSDRIVHLTPFSSDPAAITSGLGGVEAGGGTALNDDLYLALKRLEARQGRRVAIVLSDGVDVHSLLRMSEVLWTARRSQALIYWIRLGNPGRHSSSWRSEAEHAREVAGLEQAVTESGGRIVPIARIEQAGDVFREILAELREQYVLGYYPTRDLDDGSWHRVRVEVRGSGLSVRTREGYLDY